MVGAEDLRGSILVDELATLFCRLGFALDVFKVDSFFAEEEDMVEEVEVDFFLVNSARTAVTTASTSDCVDRDWTAEVLSIFFASVAALLGFSRWGGEASEDRLSRLLLDGDRLSSLLLNDN